jgi:pyruvate dehydrogenase E2 component (dihydrolipoamide acetyltransferase)
MTEVTDLLMPKLGLTMTEGTVARWLTVPGARFAPGDVVVVIETDKIANEVEAPAAGELVAQLSPEGAVVSVGAPIARWRLDETSGSQAGPRVAAEPPPVARPPAAHIPELSPTVVSGRVVATPYARRLARETSLDLGGIAGSGPRGRIKAADVTRALEGQSAPPSVAPVGASALPTAPVKAQRTAPTFLTADVDVTALRALDARLAGSLDREFERRAYIALACFKALDAEDKTQSQLGFEIGGDFSVLEGQPRDTLSAVAARLAQLQPEERGGDVAILLVEGRVRMLLPALPDGWRMALGVGGVRGLRSGGDASHEMTLALAYDDSVDRALAARLLDRIVALLEEPLHLLAG